MFPIGYFRFPKSSKHEVFHILNINKPEAKEKFDSLFDFVIPIANIFYAEIIQEGPLDGNFADRGIESWRNIFRIRKAFYENKFYRDEI